MIILGQRGNSDMLPVASEVHFLPLQGRQVGAFVDVHFGQFLPGRFSPASRPGL